MPPCQQTLLSRGASAQLTRCSCGHLHLSLGPVTLRLEEAALRDAFGTLAEAVAALDAGAGAAAGGRSGPRGWAQ